MNLYTQVISSLIFPLQERLKHHDTVRVRKDMEASQYWPLDKLEALRVSRLKALLHHTGAHVPYYRDLFARLGFDPAKVSSTEDLQRLPFLDKAAIRSQLPPTMKIWA